MGFEDITFERRHLSPHGASVVTHETDGERRLLVQQGHRHGGVRYLEVRAGSDDGLVGDARRDRRVNPDPAVDREEPIGWLQHETDWSLVDVGNARPRNGGTTVSRPAFRRRTRPTASPSPAIGGPAPMPPVTRR